MVNQRHFSNAAFLLLLKSGLYYFNVFLEHTY